MKSILSIISLLILLNPQIGAQNKNNYKIPTKVMFGEEWLRLRNMGYKDLFIKKSDSWCQRTINVIFVCEPDLKIHQIERELYEILKSSPAQKAILQHCTILQTINIYRVTVAREEDEKPNNRINFQREALIATAKIQKEAIRYVQDEQINAPFIVYITETGREIDENENEYGKYLTNEFNAIAKSEYSLENLRKLKMELKRHRNVEYTTESFQRAWHEKIRSLEEEMSKVVLLSELSKLKMTSDSDIKGLKEWTKRYATCFQLSVKFLSIPKIEGEVTESDVKDELNRKISNHFKSEKYLILLDSIPSIKSKGVLTTIEEDYDFLNWAMDSDDIKNHDSYSKLRVAISKKKAEFLEEEKAVQAEKNKELYKRASCKCCLDKPKDCPICYGTGETYYYHVALKVSLLGRCQTCGGSGINKCACCRRSSYD